MRAFLFGVVLIIASSPAFAQKTIRQVDFKNFVYPLNAHLLGHAQMQWLDMSMNGPIKGQSVQLTNGRSPAGSPGFTLQSVEYGDATGEGKDDAIVALAYSTGAAPIAHYIYIYSLVAGKPKLLAYCHFGNGGYSGFSRAYSDKGQLVIESLDPQKPAGDPSSAHILRRRFHWQNGHFEPVGQPEIVPKKQP